MAPAEAKLPGEPEPTKRVAALFLIVLALLPWSRFPPFPWLHAHAQWSDVVFGVTAALWVLWRRPRMDWFHGALLAYVAAAGWALVWTASAAALWKWVGIVELAALAAVTRDLASQPGMRRSIARVTAGTALVVGAAALVGVALFAAGISTPLVGTYGDLVPSMRYARVQVGAIHPNLLASWCVFAAACIARDDDTRRRPWGRLALAALATTLLFTFSRAILSFAAAVAVWMAPPRARRAVAIGCGVTAAAIVVALTVVNVTLDPTRPLDAGVSAAPGPRLVALRAATATAIASPLHGCGLDCVPGRAAGFVMDAHCTVVNVAAVSGLPGLAALLLVLWRIARDRRRPADVAVWCALLAIAIESLATDVEDFRHVWVLFGLAVAKDR